MGRPGQVPSLERDAHGKFAELPKRLASPVFKLLAGRDFVDAGTPRQGLDGLGSAQEPFFDRYGDLKVVRTAAYVGQRLVDDVFHVGLQPLGRKDIPGACDDYRSVQPYAKG